MLHFYTVVTSLVDHDVTDDGGEYAFNATVLGDDLDVDVAASQRAAVVSSSGALDEHLGPVEGAVDSTHRPAEAACRRDGVAGARSPSSYVDVDAFDFAPLVRRHRPFFT